MKKTLRVINMRKADIRIASPFQRSYELHQKFCFKVNFIPVDAVSSCPIETWLIVVLCSGVVLCQWSIDCGVVWWSPLRSGCSTRIALRKANKGWGKVHNIVSLAHTRMLWLVFHEIPVSHCPSPHNCPSSHLLTHCCIFRGHRTCVCLGVSQRGGPNKMHCVTGQGVHPGHGVQKCFLLGWASWEAHNQHGGGLRAMSPAWDFPLRRETWTETKWL